MLQKFSGDDNKHLISLLASYEQVNQYFLLFHWADADLLKYWNHQNPCPSMEKDFVLWVAAQCEGIGSGLHRIHSYKYSDTLLGSNTGRNGDGSRGRRSRRNSQTTSGVRRNPSIADEYGRHGDIKPENILWFKDPHNANDLGVLKISDFGLADFKRSYKALHKPKSQTYHTPTYRPPEADLDDGEITQRSDIWPLACVYLEFVTWMLGGSKLVKQFADTRISPSLHGFKADDFFEIIPANPPQSTTVADSRVKPVVEDVS
jgi:serine/threonine protein kinase